MAPIATPRIVLPQVGIVRLRASLRFEVLEALLSLVRAEVRHMFEES